MQERSADLSTNEITECRVCGLQILGKSHFEVIVPLYKSELHVLQVIQYINKLNSLVQGGVSATFVVDGRDSDYSAIAAKINEIQTEYKIIRLTKNFGVGPAIHAALSNSSKCVSSAFGSDLQEPMQLFVDFFETTITLESDVAIGYRIERNDPVVSLFFSKMYWWINRKWIHPESPKGGLDVFAMNKKVRNEFVKLRELNTNFTSQLLWIGYKVKWFGFERLERGIGKSTWTLRRKMKLFADSVYGFTSKPISLITWMGFLSSGFFLLLGVATFLAKLTGNIEVPGYAMIVLLLSFGQSITIFSLGILGGYIYRIFDNATNRPNFVIDSIYESNK